MNRIRANADAVSTNMALFVGAMMLNLFIFVMIEELLAGLRAKRLMGCLEG